MKNLIIALILIVGLSSCAHLRQQEREQEERNIRNTAPFEKIIKIPNMTKSALFTQKLSMRMKKKELSQVDISQDTLESSNRSISK